MNLQTCGAVGTRASYHLLAPSLGNGHESQSAGDMWVFMFGRITSPVHVSFNTPAAYMRFCIYVPMTQACMCFPSTSALRCSRPCRQILPEVHAAQGASPEAHREGLGAAGMVDQKGLVQGRPPAVSAKEAGSPKETLIFGRRRMGQGIADIGGIFGQRGGLGPP